MYRLENIFGSIHRAMLLKQTSSIYNQIIWKAFFRGKRKKNSRFRCFVYIGIE